MRDTDMERYSNEVFDQVFLPDDYHTLIEMYEDSDLEVWGQACMDAEWFAKWGGFVPVFVGGMYETPRCCFESDHFNCAVYDNERNRIVVLRRSAYENLERDARKAQWEWKAWANSCKKGEPA